MINTHTISKRAIVDYITKNIIFVSVIVFAFVGCSIQNEDDQDKTRNLQNDLPESVSILNQEQDNKYKYINGYVSFERKIDDNFIYYSDTDYTDKHELYTGKVRWSDNDADSRIVSAAQVIEVDKKIMYSQSLEIMNYDIDSTNWNHYVSYSPSIKCPCYGNNESFCYIKLNDNNNTEYQVMLEPIDTINQNGYFGSAVHIIDGQSGEEYWY